MKKPRSILLALFTLLLVLVLCACSSKTTAFSFDGASFDISESNDNSLTANLKKVKNNYTLTIKGSGNSKDYESTSKLPWNVVSKMIDEVKIENGITKIGKNLFSSLSLKRFFIPESVESIEENAFKDNVTIYSYSLNAVNSSKAIMYLYSETKPVESGRYFRMVGEEPVVWQTNKILFIGNSFTFYPTGLETPAVPLIFKSVAEDLGVDVIVDYVLKGAHTLTGFANENDEMGMIVDEKLKASNDYDYVVLQEQSVAPIDSYNNFFSAVTKLKEKINKTQDHAKIYLYATWGFPSKITGSGIYQSISTMEKAIRDAYDNCASELDLKVSYVGKAFTEVYNNHKDINLYWTDDKHQGYTGAYLSALVHLGTILRVDVRNTTFKGELTEEVASTLKQVAYETAFKDSYSSGSVPKQEDDNIPEDAIVIAWYAKTTKSNLDATFINSINESLKDYLKTQSVSDEEIAKVIFKGYDGTVGVATKAIVDDKYVSLMLGFGSVDNVTTTGVIPANSIVKSTEDLSIKGATRSLIMLKESTLSSLIYDYLISENGRKLFE